MDGVASPGTRPCPASWPGVVCRILYESVQDLIPTHQSELFPRDSFLSCGIRAYSSLGARERIDRALE
jgi:hypothetical protein